MKPTHGEGRVKGAGVLSGPMGPRGFGTKGE